MTKKLLLFAIILIFFIFAIFFYCSNRMIKINNHQIKVEAVSNMADLQKGLGGREKICDNCGMLFNFSTSGIYSFWMKDMRFPLDILWINNGKIVHIEKNVSPIFLGTLKPEEAANKVLEINAGKCEQWGIKIGDEVYF